MGVPLRSGKGANAVICKDGVNLQWLNEIFAFRNNPYFYRYKNQFINS